MQSGEGGGEGEFSMQEIVHWAPVLVMLSSDVNCTIILPLFCTFGPFFKQYLDLKIMGTHMLIRDLLNFIYS